MKFLDDTLKLLEQVNQVYPGSVILRGQGEASGVITHDQVTTEMLETRLMVEVTDATAPDFQATHELLHMLLTLSGFPQVYFQLKTGDEDVTNQLMVMATYLYRPAIHAIIYREQAKHGLITADVANAYAKGVMTTLTKETPGNRDEAALRLLTLLDAKVFMHNVATDTTALTDTFMDAFPEAWQGATLIYDQMAVDHIVDAFTLHQAIVTAFDGFDAMMITWQLPELNSKEFTTVTPVLSERQLRLPVSQVFDIKHVEWLNQATGDTAYVGLQKSSGQNSFVLAAPKEATADWFKELYATSVQELFEQMKQPFTIR